MAIWGLENKPPDANKVTFDNPERNLERYARSKVRHLRETVINKGADDPPTTLDVAKALESLTGEKSPSMKSYARCRMRGQRSVFGKDYEDLHQEAILKMLDDRRPWKLGVDPAAHLVFSMRSISSGWYQTVISASTGQELLRLKAESDAIADTGKEWARNIVSRVIALLRNDSDALIIMDSRLDGMRPQDIQQMLGMDRKAYNAAWQRIRRCTKRVAVASGRQCRHRTFSRSAHRKNLS